jgi:hypothetical protein
MDGRQAGQLISGLMLVGIGLLFFADVQGWKWGWHLTIYRLWPVGLIVLGLTKLIVPIDEMVTPPDHAGPAVPVRHYRLGGGFWMITVGVLMTLHLNHIMRLQQTWPLFIVAGGLAIVFGDRRPRRRRERNS